MCHRQRSWKDRPNFSRGCVQSCCDAAPQLGQPFLRGDMARGGVASGLGLSIAARLHGGELLLANRPGGGFTATVRLPIPTR